MLTWACVGLLEALVAPGHGTGTSRRTSKARPPCSADEREIPPTDMAPPPCLQLLPTHRQALLASVQKHSRSFFIRYLRSETKSGSRKFKKSPKTTGLEPATCTSREQVRSGRVDVYCTQAPTGWAAGGSYTPGLCARTSCPAAPDTPSVYRSPDQLGINGGRTYSVVRGSTVSRRPAGRIQHSTGLVVSRAPAHTVGLVIHWCSAVCV